MLHAGLDLSRRRLDFHLLREDGELVEAGAAPPDADGLRGLAERVTRHGEPIQAAVESMNGARFVHDQLERSGWEVQIADAQKVKGLAPLACKTDRIDAWVLAELSRRELVPAIWLPDPEVRAERERARWRLHLVRHRSSLKHRIHATLLAHGRPCPVSELFGQSGRGLLAAMDLPEPWRGHLETGLGMIDALDREIAGIDRELRRLGAEHRYVALLTTVPGDRLGARIHDRRGDRRHRALRQSEEALRLHRALPARLPVRRAGPPRLAREERAEVPALGAHGGGDARVPAPGLPRALPAPEAAPRPPARAEGRPRPQARRGDLAHAHPQPALRSGRRHAGSGRIDGPF